MTSLSKLGGEFVATGTMAQTLATMLRRRWNLWTRFWPEVALNLRPKQHASKIGELEQVSRPS